MSQKAQTAPELIVEAVVDPDPINQQVTPEDTGDGTYGASYRSGSVYFDAYEGIEVRDQMA